MVAVLVSMVGIVEHVSVPIEVELLQHGSLPHWAHVGTLARAAARNRTAFAILLVDIMKFSFGAHALLHFKVRYDEKRRAHSWVFAKVLPAFTG